MARPIQLKRTLTPGKASDSLAEGEIALGIGDDPPRMWIGTPTGVKEFAAELRELKERIEALESALRRAQWRRDGAPSLC